MPVRGRLPSMTTQSMTPVPEPPPGPGLIPRADMTGRIPRPDTTGGWTPSGRLPPDWNTGGQDWGDLIRGEIAANPNPWDLSGDMMAGGGAGGRQVNQDALNMGMPMYPWLMPYTGDFTASMSPYEMEGLGGFSDWLQGGMGMGPAKGYMEDVLGGEYLDPARNKWLAQIEQGAMGRKKLADEDAMRRIGSSMAAGGNALSGARLGAEAQYQSASDAAFNEDIGRLMSGNYQFERGQQTGMLPFMSDTARMQGGGYQDLMRMGALPRELEQQDLNRSYGDWLRQTEAFRDQNRYSDQLAMDMLRGGGYRGQTPKEYGESSLEQLLPILAMTGAFGGAGGAGWLGNLLGGAAGGIGDWLGNIFGGGGGGGEEPELSEDDWSFLDEGFGGGEWYPEETSWEDMFNYPEYEDYTGGGFEDWNYGY